MNELKNTIESLAAKIDASPSILPSYGRTEDFAKPHIETHGNEYHWVVVERGKELKRDKTTDLNEFLYWVFEYITFNMACTLELENRIENQDFRIQLFEIQENLISKINPKYQERLHVKHSKLLNAN